MDHRAGTAEFPSRSGYDITVHIQAHSIDSAIFAEIVENGRLDLLTAYDDELNYGVDYWYWDFASNLKFGCAFGGTIKYLPTSKGANLVLKDCAFVDGSTATGTGVIDDSAGSFRLDVTFSGDWHGSATYRRAPNGTQSLTGTLSYSAP